MAKTFTDQVNMPNTRWTNDGAGMHSAIPFDMVRGLNNLGTYINNHAQYVQCSDGLGSLSMGVATNGREAFMYQIPVVVPAWAKRLLWTQGVSCSAGSLSAVTAYLSASRYTGPGGNAGTNLGAFDSTAFFSRIVARTSVTTVTAGNYALINDSTTGFTDIPTSLAFGIDTGRKLTAHMIITITVSSSSSAVAANDFTCWFAPS